MKKLDNICPSCSECNLQTLIMGEAYTYKGESFSLENVEYSICPKCGIEIFLPEQEKQLDRRVRDEYRKIDGLLTSAEIREIRKKLGLNKQQASNIFGGGPNSFSKYESGEVTQSRALDRFLRKADLYPFIINEDKGIHSNLLGFTTIGGTIPKNTTNPKAEITHAGSGDQDIYLGSESTYFNLENFDPADSNEKHTCN